MSKKKKYPAFYFWGCLKILSRLLGFLGTLMVVIFSLKLSNREVLALNAFGVVLFVSFWIFAELYQSHPLMYIQGGKLRINFPAISLLASLGMFHLLVLSAGVTLGILTILTTLKL